MQATLSTFIDPNLGCTLADMGARIIKTASDAYEVILPYPKQVGEDAWRDAMADFLRSQNLDIVVEARSETRVRQVGRGLSAHGQIKNMIAVGSGKGGVGKSTTSVLLALGLAQLGLRVGILDADIYGPNIPTLLGVEKRLAPEEVLTVADISVMSMALLSDQPMMWRGPMVSKAIMDMLNQTKWPPLDYLVVDLPPGTGDAQLTMAKQCPITAALMVTTSHPLSVVDTLKNIVMFNKVGIPMLGILENMSEPACPACGHARERSEGAAHLSEVCELPILARWPSGEDWATLPLQANEALQGPAQALAWSVLQQVMHLPIEYRQAFGEIKVEKKL